MGGLYSRGLYSEVYGIAILIYAHYKGEYDNTAFIFIAISCADLI